MVSKTSSLHSRLIGNLNFMAQALTNPAVIQEQWTMGRNTEEKDGKIVHTHYFIEPQTGTLVPTSVAATSFLGLNGAGRPRCTRLWDNVDDLYSHVTLAEDVGFMELPAYNEVITALGEIAIDPTVQNLVDDPNTSEDVLDAIRGAKAISEKFDQFAAPIDPADILDMFSEDTCKRRYRMFKIDAGTELIKALRLVRHPGQRKKFARLFATEIAKVNPVLADVVRALTK